MEVRQRRSKPTMGSWSLGRLRLWAHQAYDQEVLTSVGSALVLCFRAEAPPHGPLC
jgi:hypothetical protein